MYYSEHCFVLLIFFFFNDTATTEIYTLSLHDALPIFSDSLLKWPWGWRPPAPKRGRPRSEEHTSELQSRRDLVCRLLLEKKKTNYELQSRRDVECAPFVGHYTDWIH